MPTYLADKSALGRAHVPSVAGRLESLFLNGEIATCGIVDLELLFSARTTSDYLSILADRKSLPHVELGEVGIDRAIEVQTAMARRSQHRGASIPDLLIAAAAEAAHLCVLHYDADFDLISQFTGQPAEWVVPAGSVS